MDTILKDRSDRRIAYRIDREVRRRLGIAGRFRLMLAHWQADQMLRRLTRRKRIDTAAKLSPHLLKDIGLPPDFRL